MSMTHYMELLASNQPWNLILFMAIPVILDTMVVSSYGDATTSSGLVRIGWLSTSILRNPSIPT